MRFRGKVKNSISGKKRRGGEHTDQIGHTLLHTVYSTCFKSGNVMIYRIQTRFPGEYLKLEHDEPLTLDLMVFTFFKSKGEKKKKEMLS